MRFSTAFLIVCFACALSATSLRAADEPSEDRVRTAIEFDLRKKDDLRCEIVNIDGIWMKTGENTLEGQVLVTLKLTEDHYAVEGFNDLGKAIQEKYGIDYASIGNALRDARELAERQKEPLRTALMEQIPATPQNVLVMGDPAGTEVTVRYAIRAVKDGDDWNPNSAAASWSRPVNGAPRSFFSKELPFDSPEAEKLLKEYVGSVQAYDGVVKKAVADAAAAAGEKRTAMLEILKPGGFLSGAVIRGGERFEVGMLVEQADSQTNSVQGSYFNDLSDPRQAKPFMIILPDADAPLKLSVNFDKSKLTAELDLQDGVLKGKASNRPTGLGSRQEYDLSLAPEHREVLDAKIAALNKVDEDYLSSLSAALTPGNVFTGSWTYRGNRGNLAFAIENVAQDGFSCTGYLFDPADQSKRKAFSGVINRDLGAETVLTIKAESAGVRSTKANPVQLTESQKIWLVDRRTYPIWLGFKNGAWTGRSGGNGPYMSMPLEFSLQR